MIVFPFSFLKDLNLLVDTLIAGIVQVSKHSNAPMIVDRPSFLNDLNLLVDTLITWDCSGDPS
jgi:hypothetical protein